MKQTKATDAVVDMDLAVKWAGELLAEKADNVIERVINSGPFVLGLAIDVARRAIDKLRKRSVPEPILDELFNRIMISNAYSIELMQRGYRNLWADVIEPAMDDAKDGGTDA